MNARWKINELGCAERPWFRCTSCPDTFQSRANLTTSGLDDSDGYLFENYQCGASRNYTDDCNEARDRLIDQQSQEPNRQPVGGTALAARQGMHRTKIQRVQPQASVTEVLDRVLDRGIVVDAWLRVSVAGTALIDVDATIVVVSIDTYVQRADDLATAGSATRSPAVRERRSRAGTAARRRARRVAMQCAAGCTFNGRWSGSPATVRCPADRRRACAVAPLPDA